MKESPSDRGIRRLTSAITVRARSAAARSATVALTNALLPYLIDIGHSDLERAVGSNGDLRRGLYLYRGACAQATLGRAFELPGASLPWAMG